MGTKEIIEKLPKERIPSALAEIWKDFFNGLLYNETENDVDYDELEEYVSMTKDCFAKTFNEGFISIENFELFEVLSTFEYLPKIFEPEKDKDKFKDLCSKMTELRKSLESISK